MRSASQQRHWERNSRTKMNKKRAKYRRERGEKLKKTTYRIREERATLKSRRTGRVCAVPGLVAFSGVAGPSAAGCHDPNARPSVCVNPNQRPYSTPCRKRKRFPAKARK